MKPYDPGDYTPSDEELEAIEEATMNTVSIPANALWNYGPEGAPTEEAEQQERTRRSLWRMIDRQLER